MTATLTTAEAIPDLTPDLEPDEAPITPPIESPLRIALIAHDGKKDEMVELAAEFATFLGRCELVATGTTGSRLSAEVGLTVERMLSGPHGGDLQIGARLAVGGIDAVIFLRDPMTPQPHEPDINALVRACDVHNVACATNGASARLLLKALQSR